MRLFAFRFKKNENNVSIPDAEILKHCRFKKPKQ